MPAGDVDDEFRPADGRPQSHFPVRTLSAKGYTEGRATVHEQSGVDAPRDVRRCHPPRHARHRAGRTQAELSARSGVVRPLISEYETGRKDPSVTTLSRLIESCGMELRIQAEVLCDAERTQRAHDEVSIGSERAMHNAERARREVDSVREPTTEEVDWLRTGRRAAS